MEFCPVEIDPSLVRRVLLIPPVLKTPPRSSEERAALQKKNNYLQRPGHHTLLSPLVGSTRKKFENLMEEEKMDDSLKSFNDAIYKQPFLYLLPNDIKSRDRADQLARKKLEEVIAPYEKNGLTYSNAVEWTDMCMPGCASNKSHIHDIENDANTWLVNAIVEQRNDTNNECNAQDNAYLPPNIVAEHELHHIQDTLPGMSEAQRQKERPYLELMETLNTLVELDDIYKQIHSYLLDKEIKYNKDVDTPSGEKIDLGKILSFYEKLIKENNGDIYAALLSSPSRKFVQKYFTKKQRVIEPSFAYSPYSSISPFLETSFSPYSSISPFQKTSLQKTPIRFAEEITALQKQHNYLQRPGHHTLLSPIVGSLRKKFENLMEEQKKDESLQLFNQAMNQPYFVHLLSNDIKSRDQADQLARRKFEEMVATFAKDGLTLSNAVHWTDLCIPGASNETSVQDLENKWNTWNISAGVEQRNDTNEECNSQDNGYLPPYIVAEREFHKIQEAMPGMSEAMWKREKPYAELMPNLNTLVELDKIYKQMHGNPPEKEIKYNKNVETPSGEKIDLGKVLLFYEKLISQNKGDIYSALLSSPSREFVQKYFTQPQRRRSKFRYMERRPSRSISPEGFQFGGPKQMRARSRSRSPSTPRSVSPVEKDFSAV